MICQSQFFGILVTVGGSNTPDECSLTNLSEEDMVGTKVMVSVSS
jgi:hypothetical protein